MEDDTINFIRMTKVALMNGNMREYFIREYIKHHLEQKQEKISND